MRRPNVRQSGLSRIEACLFREMRYGDAAVFRLDLRPSSIVADCSSPRGTALADPAEAVRAAVATPLQFPPLEAAVVPGDRVAITLGRCVPRGDRIVAGLVQYLLDTSDSLQSISVLLAEDEGTALADLSESLRAEIEVVVHDPRDSSSMSYLAASQEGKPIYFNKKICDADVVVPISTLRPDQALCYFGVHHGLFPVFSDVAAQQRYLAPNLRDWAPHQRRRREEADEAAWLLGIQLVIAVAPGPGDSLLAVLAGSGPAVAEQGKAVCEAAWTHQTPQSADLVVATIEGGSRYQTWEQFGRALYSASRAVRDGGTILLCTELACAPGPALTRLVETNDEEAARSAIRRDRSVDAISAALLADVRQHARIYLLSKLDREVSEELGLGHVSSPDEAARLIEQSESCILLGNANRAVISEVESEVYGKDQSQL